MTPNFNAIKELIEKSDLLVPEQQELILFFSKVDDNALEEILMLLAEDKWWIRKIFDNYKAKEIVFKEKDAQKMQEVVKEEERQLQALQELTI